MVKKRKVPLKEKETRPMMPDQCLRQLAALDKLYDTLPAEQMTPELYRKLKAQPLPYFGGLLNAGEALPRGRCNPACLAAWQTSPVPQPNCWAILR
jgi:hypothetical protein